MKTTLMMLCVMSALCAAGAVQKPAVKKTSLSESELRELAKSAPDVKIASALHSVAMATTNNVGRQQEYLKSAAACLFACDKRDIYQKHIKGKLQNAAEIESRLKDDCKQCSGKGKKERRCYSCSGKGQCPTCKGSGQMIAVSFGGPKGSKTCTKCNGSRRCDKCGGNGSTQDKCAACAGTGKVFSKTVAERVFRDSCNSIADSMNVAATSNNAEVTPGVGVNLKQRHVEQQNLGSEPSLRRQSLESKEIGPAPVSETLPASSDPQMDNKILDQLKNLKQDLYRIKDVVSVGNALLSTHNVPKKAMRDTPFNGCDLKSDLKFKKDVRSMVECAKTLLSDIEANKTEISTGEFKPEDYIEYWHSDTTEIRKRRIFDMIWEMGQYSHNLQHDANNNPLGKALFSKVPDNIVFVVNDVRLGKLRGGKDVYSVRLTALVFGKEDYTLGMVWKGRECQTEQYLEMAENSGALARRSLSLIVDTSHDDVEGWKKGDTVISKGWLNMWNIIDAVTTYDNGRKKAYRKIKMSGEMVRDIDTLLE